MGGGGQVHHLGTDKPGYFYTSSPVIGDQFNRIQGRLPGVKAHIERKQSGSRPHVPDVGLVLLCYKTC